MLKGFNASCKQLFWHAPLYEACLFFIRIRRFGKRHKRICTFRFMNGYIPVSRNFSVPLCITSRCLTFSIVYALRVCQHSDRYIVLPGIRPGGQNIKTTEIKPMAYVNPYQKGGDQYVFKIRGKPKRRS